MSIRFERQSLYEEVWSEPLTRLGKKYGLSDNGLRKVCIALNIPLPKAGHWTKIAAGHQVPRVPLPEKSDKTEFISNPKPAEAVTIEQNEDMTWLKEREAFESSQANHIYVDLQPKKFHSMLIETHNRLAEKLKEIEKTRIEAEKEAKRPAGRKWEPNMNSSTLSYFESRGQLLELHRWGMPFRFTPKTCDRGLAIANALFSAAESRGFKIVKDKESNKLNFKLDDGLVYIRMSEKLKQDVRILKNPSDLDLRLSQEHIKIPTGTLRFHLCASGSSSEVEMPDTDDKPLQENLNQVFCRIYKLIVQSRAHSRKLAEWHRKYEEEKRQREEKEKIRQEEIKLQEMELQKRAALLKEASDWRNSELIYKYIAHLDNTLSGIGLDISKEKNYREWRNWALNAASALDQTSQRINELIKN
ncbi:hypothetical protein [Methylotenera sp.]|uniref:hypothetical protein n=1 Tax=Methylotenera sp. TaxID=2051956 RepID=UPI0027277228|nr:hypothetical protein [Methylotenera sp.]MDO9204134.1 hypothetical protein [Methylotenera sp.]MDP2071736.1 hypothetical protein [Methylotenera sp.]MDP3006058.1 hypothetical protein [Methylotenera sp.]